MNKANFIRIVALLIGMTPVAVAADIEVVPTGDSALDRAKLYASLAVAAPASKCAWWATAAAA